MLFQMIINVSFYFHFVCEFGLRIRLILVGTMNDRHGVCPYKAADSLMGTSLEPNSRISSFPVFHQL